MPRLIKGEVAPGVQAKTAAAQKSALSRIEYFTQLVKENNPADVAWLHFRNLDSLSQMLMPELGIDPISPKTLRKHMVTMYEGGVAGLLLDAKKITELSRGPSVNSRKTDRFEELQVRTQIAVDSALEMTARYLDLLEKFQKIARGSDSAKIALDRHFRRYGSNPHIRLVKE